MKPKLPKVKNERKRKVADPRREELVFDDIKNKIINAQKELGVVLCFSLKEIREIES